MTYLLLIATAALLSWTLTREEVTRELRTWLTTRRLQCCAAEYAFDSEEGGQSRAYWRCLKWCNFVYQKLLYLPTCDYCTSHWVMLILLLFVQPAPLAGSWLLTYFSLVAGTVLLLALFYLVRQAGKLVATIASNAARVAELQAEALAKLKTPPDLSAYALLMPRHAMGLLGSSPLFEKKGAGCGSS